MTLNCCIINIKMRLVLMYFIEEDMAEHLVVMQLALVHLFEDEFEQFVKAQHVKHRMHSLLFQDTKERATYMYLHFFVCCIVIVMPMNITQNMAVAKWC